MKGRRGRTLAKGTEIDINILGSREKKAYRAKWKEGLEGMLEMSKRKARPHLRVVRREKSHQ